MKNSFRWFGDRFQTTIYTLIQESQGVFLLFFELFRKETDHSLADGMSLMGTLRWGALCLGQGDNSNMKIAPGHAG